MMALSGPLDGSASGLVLGVIRVGPEDDDAQFAILRLGGGGGSDEQAGEQEEGVTHEPSYAATANELPSGRNRAQWGAACAAAVPVALSWLCSGFG